MQVKCKKRLCSVRRRCRDWQSVLKVVWEVSWYYWHFGQIICCGAVLCIGRCLVAPLASTHWKPIIAGYSQILKISKSVKFLVKMKNVSFILWKKLNGLFGQLNVQDPAEVTPAWVWLVGYMNASYEMDNNLNISPNMSYSVLECDIVVTWLLAYDFVIEHFVKEKEYCPGWCGSVDWVPNC